MHLTKNKLKSTPYPWLVCVSWYLVEAKHLQGVFDPAIWYYSNSNKRWQNHAVFGHHTDGLVAFKTQIEQYAVDIRTKFAQKHFPELIKCKQSVASDYAEFLGKTYRHRDGFMVAGRVTGKTLKFIHINLDGSRQFFDEDLEELNSEDLRCTNTRWTVPNYDSHYCLENFKKWKADFPDEMVEVESHELMKDPRKVPYDAAPLPDDKPWLVYLGKGVCAPKNFGSDSEDLYWDSMDIVFSPWRTSASHGGVVFKSNHYAIDARSPLAKERFPLLVKALNYKDPVAEGLNPHGLTEYQVGVGWKLLPETMKLKRIISSEIEYWDTDLCEWKPKRHFNIDGSVTLNTLDAYRIPEEVNPLDLLAVDLLAEGHNPRQVTEGQLGYGYRTLPKSFVGKKIDKRLVQYWKPGIKAWSTASTFAGCFSKVTKSDTYRTPIDVAPIDTPEKNKVVNNDLELATKMLEQFKQDTREQGICSMIELVEMVRKHDR